MATMNMPDAIHKVAMTATAWPYGSEVRCAFQLESFSKNYFIKYCSITLNLQEKKSQMLHKYLVLKGASLGFYSVWDEKILHKKFVAVFNTIICQNQVTISKKAPLN